MPGEMIEAATDDILFVGDIQGCREPLERLLREAGYEPDRHRLVPVGDTVNRGPDSAGTLALLRRLGAEPILGNHEHRLLTIDPDRLAEDAWLARQSLRRDLAASPRFAEWLEWIRTWPVHRRGTFDATEANGGPALEESGQARGGTREWIAVHAGLHPRLAIAQTSVEFLTRVRACDADGNLPPAGLRWDGTLETMPPGFRPWHEFHRGEELVLYGHWARQGLHRTARTIGLDSGCVYGGVLSGWWLKAGFLVQVEGLR
jgi:bis(5'-nucleosyl)-tetraphosphatase (symmetrical)